MISEQVKTYVIDTSNYQVGVEAFLWAEDTEVNKDLENKAYPLILVNPPDGTGFDRTNELSNGILSCRKLLGFNVRIFGRETREGILDRDAIKDSLETLLLAYCQQIMNPLNPKRGSLKFVTKNPDIKIAIATDVGKGKLITVGYTFQIQFQFNPVTGTFQ